ncbi:MAG: LysR family transcriptional regulator [Chitinophagia bacterium]|nr:LysR family transcriptional regulator [Chitinophagia bacterium]
MDLTLNQLEVLLRVARTGSITKAADEMNLTQPAVSIQLRNLQRQFDIPITEVVNRRLFLTDFGREMAAAAERILDEVHAIEGRTLDIRGKMTGRLRISSVSTGKYVIPYFLGSFLRMHEGVELELEVSNKASVMQDLADNAVDFSLVSVLPEDVHLKRIELMPNVLYLIGRNDGSSLQPIHDPREIEGLPLIYREQGSATRMAMERFFERKRIRVRKKMELTSNEAVKQAVIAGLGYSIMPIIGLRHELAAGQLRIIPARGLPLRTNWNLVWPADKRHSPVAEALKDHLRKEKHGIIRQHFVWCEEHWISRQSPLRH